MNKDWLFSKQGYAVILIVFILLSFFGLFVVKKFTGYAGSPVDAQAGIITELLIDQRRSTAFWAGVFGLIFSEDGFNEEQSQTFEPGVITSYTVVFECFSVNEAEQEIYASMNETINFNNITAGSFDMIDNDLFNFTESHTDGASATFVTNVSILLGLRNISGIPGVYTYTNSQPGVIFFTGILNDSGQVVMVGRAYTTSQTSFKGNSIRYQMMLPVNNESVRWYFFPDPNDECPAGLSSGTIGPAYIEGYIIDSVTNLSIPNVTVGVKGSTTTTNASGYYNISTTSPAEGAIEILLAIKQGYNTNISYVNISVGNLTIHNISLDPFLGYVGPNATVIGYARDNTTGAPLGNVTVSSSGIVTMTNGSGNFTFNVSGGFHHVSALKSGYFNFINNYTIEPYENITMIINLTPANIGAEEVLTPLLNGTIQGFVTDNTTNLSISNATVLVNNVQDLSNGSGFYNLTTISGTTNLIGSKVGYEVYASEVFIPSENQTDFNFSLQPVADEGGTGAVEGYVRTLTSLPIEGATIYLVGLTNGTNEDGFYEFETIPSGEHTIAATAPGYLTNFSSINVSTGLITVFNFTLDEFTEPGLGSGSGAGSGAGQGPGSGSGLGAGQGPGTGLQAIIQEPVEVDDVVISLERILKKVKQGSFTTLPLILKNNKLDRTALNFEIVGDVTHLVKLEKEGMILEGGESESLEVTILGNDNPGIYEGLLIISGDIDFEMPIYLLILQKDRLAIETLLVEVTPENDRFSSGSDVTFRVDLQNLLTDEKYKIQLSYWLEPVEEGEPIFFETEEVVIFTSYSLIKKYQIPPDVPNGNYKIRVNAKFLDLESDHYAIFTIGEPWWNIKIFGVIPLWILLLTLLLVSTLGYGAYYIRKKLAAKKRFQIKIDLDELPKEGPRTVKVGMIAERKTPTFFNLDQFQVHTIVAGSTGSGKSVAAQVICEEALMKKAAVMVFDPTAQWTGFLRKSTDKRMHRLYRQFGIKKSEARAFNGNIKQILDAREIIDVKKYIKPGEITVFSINKLDPSDADVLVANAIREVFHANLPESPELKLIMVFDEVHRLLPKYGGSGQGFLQIERATREFRKWGVGLVLISQVLKDFVGETKANINTQLQMRTSDEGDLTRIKEDFGENIVQSIVKASSGTGMVENSSYNKGNPYFVSFRPLLHNTSRLDDKELDNYYKYNEIIDDIEYELDQLDADKIDTFDLRLELKLAQDKVKSGSFNMVDIYLEGLKPRIKQQWDKIGKTPEKRKKRYVSSDDLKDELERAKQEMTKKEEKDTSDAISKAKGAQGASKETPKAEEESQPQNVVQSTLDKFKQAISAQDKPTVKKLYASLQKLYKTASKEEKLQILAQSKSAQLMFK